MACRFFRILPKESLVRRKRVGARNGFVMLSQVFKEPENSDSYHHRDLLFLLQKCKAFPFISESDLFSETNLLYSTESNILFIFNLSF